MYFSGITLQGFKSFLDETTIPLEVGLTGVVGPNGCGKSNVVEALRWVMGESNARKMRGDDMDDIIFMGTSSRAARNLAEVTLNIVNEDKSDPLPHPWQDLNELAVKRTLTRGAGSSYRINGKEVRGKDVQYLFMARATGASSASMVAQGRISNIINAKAGERRMVLEEAAGVRALSARRHESELKLEATNKTLAEVGNIIAGLEAAQGKLLKDAKQAELYRTLSKEISDLEVSILTIKHYLESNKIKNLEQELFQLQKEQNDLIAGEGKTARELATEAEQHIGLKSEMESLNNEFIESGRLLTELKAEEKRYQNELLLTRQRHEEIKLDLDNALKEINQSAEQERVLLLNCEAREQKFPQEEEALRALQKNEQDVLLALKAKEDTFASKQKVFGEWLQAQSRATSELNYLQEALTGYQTQHQAKTKQLAEVEAKLASLKERGDAKTSVATAEKKYNQAEKDYNQLQKNLNQTKNDWLEKKESYQNELTEKQRALHQAEVAQKEMSAEITALKKMLGAGEDDLLTLMEVASGFEKALAVALMDEVESGLEETKQQHWQGFGAEQFIGQTSRLALPPLLAKVSAPKPLTRNLTMTYWVEKFSDGKRHQAELSPGEKIVSKDGGLIRWDGFTINPMTGAEDSASRKLSAKNRLKKLNSDWPALEKNSEQLALAMTTWQAKETAVLKKMADEVTALEQKMIAQNHLVAESKKQWQESQGAMMASLGQQEQLNTTRNILTTEIDNLAAQITKGEKSVTAHIKTHGNAQDEIEKRQQAMNDEEEKLKQLRQQHIDAQLQFQQQQQLVNRHHEDLKNMHLNVAEVMKRKQEKEKQIILLKERLETANDNIAKLSTLPAELLEKIAFQERAYQVKKDAQTAVGEKLLSAENMMRDKNKELKEWQEKLYMVREKIARAETLAQVSKDNLQNLAQESEGKELIAIEAVQATIGEKVTINEGFLSKQELSLRDKINKRERMGPVNLLADQNLQETAADIEKLSTEKKDLDEAVAKLQNAIAKLNSEARQKISEAFHQVNENFARLFKILFGGGEASLYFDGDSDPLTAGLEFTVHPPGKKPGPLSLLSGGEQTLTALALIFAVMDMNPPPIAVLDEVDAPLDDANIHRFTQLLRQRKVDNPQTRYLVITHHRLTMARMDRLFGVTMAEKGLSTIVGVNLETAAALAGKKVA
ncbi:MAG: chromosome segregation protein SMC [Hydrotalea sp.]|nr:chromosome segregation protein SMC [Hydrotalea sp.]